MTFEGFRLRIRKEYIKHTKRIRKKKIKLDSFTIISNNCWGGTVYESYDLIKQSPTVGMYFAPKEYLRFIGNLEHYLTQEQLKFISPLEARNCSLFSKDNTFGEYPVACLGDVEIAMLHYHSETEAKEKWERRCERINWDKLIIKMNDQNGCTYEDMSKFLAADIKCNKKLFFTCHKKWATNENIVYVPQFNTEAVCASMEPFGSSRLCNINRVINQL